MTNAHEIFDRTLLRQRRNRLARLIPGGDFLLRRVGDDLHERLQAINRNFDVCVDLGGYHGVIGERLSTSDAISTVISTETSAELSAMCQRPRLLCDEELLPFRRASLDLLVSGLTLHMVNDLPGSLAQIRMCLKPDGLFMAAVLGPRSLEELRQSFAEAESDIEGGASPRVAPFAGVRELGSLLQRTGYAMPVVDRDIVNVTYTDPLALMREIKALGMSNPLQARRRKLTRRRTLQRALEIYGEKFIDDNGRARATFEIITMTGWAPSDNQPKPLRPGSAQQRLSDALGTTEQSANEKATPDGST